MGKPRWGCSTTSRCSTTSAGGIRLSDRSAPQPMNDVLKWRNQTVHRIGGSSDHDEGPFVWSVVAVVDVLYQCCIAGRREPIAVLLVIGPQVYWIGRLPPQVPGSIDDHEAQVGKVSHHRRDLSRFIGHVLGTA